MSEELKQVGGEAETMADTDAMDGAAASMVEGSAGSDSALGQAARVITPPPAGQTDIIKLAPGERFELAANPATVKLVVDGNDLVLGFDLDEDGTPDSFVVLDDLVLAAGGGNPPVLMVAGEPIGVDLLIGNAQALGQTDQGGPGADLETAAEPAAQGSGATAYSDNLGDAIDLLVAQGVIPPVELQFGLIELEDEIFVVEEDNEPPLADPVLTPASLADGGEGGGLPADLVEALSQVGAVIVSETVTIAGPNLPGSVQYVYFTLTEPTAVTIFTDGPTIDPQIYLFVDDGSLDIGDLLATDDDDGSPAGSFSNSIINTGDEIGILPAGNYVVAVSDFSLSAAEAVAGLNDSTNLTGDVTVTVLAQPAPDSVIFFKQLIVDGSIGDDDSGVIADFGGADAETSLENLVFTLQSNPTFGQLILVTVGGDTSFLTPGDTFSSEDTVWWIATEDQIAAFLALPGAPEFLPDVNFDYSVTDEAGGVATAPVVITLPPPTPPRTALGIEQGDCLNEDTEGSLLFAAYPTDGASKISQIVISGFPTGAAADAWVVDEASVDIFGYTLGIDYTTSYNALTGELTIDFITASFSLGESVQGTVDVTPNPDSDVDQTLTIEATAINGAGSATDAENSLIPVDADADGAEGGSGDDGDGIHLSVSASVADGDDDGGSFQPDEVGTLNVVATFDDFLDGSETHTIQVFAAPGFTILEIDEAGLPAGVTLISNDGSIAIFGVETLGGVGSVNFDLPIQNTGAEEGEADFFVRALAEETNTGDVECVEGGEGGFFPVAGDNAAFVEAEAAATIANVAPPEISLSLYGGEDCIEEDSSTEDFTNEVSLTVTPDGDDLLTEIVLSGFQQDWGYDLDGLDTDGVGTGVAVTDNIAIDGTVTIAFEPGTNLAYSGSFAVEPPADSDVDHPTITASATVVDPVDNALTDSADTTIDIHVDANADGAEGAGGDDGDSIHLSVGIVVSENNADGNESFQTGESGVLEVSATFDDFQDGSEAHTVNVTAPTGFTIGDAITLPDGVTVQSNDGTTLVLLVDSQDGDGQDGIGSFTATFVVTNESAADGSAAFEAEAKAVETTTGDEECDTSEADNIATTADETEVTVFNAAIPTVELRGAPLCIDEDGSGSFYADVETTAGVLHEVTLDGLVALEGAGWIVSVSDSGAGGSYDPLTGIYTADGVDASVVLEITLTPPADSDLDVFTTIGQDIVITATATDGFNVTDPSLPAEADVNVDADADGGPDASVVQGVDDGDLAGLSVSVSVSDDSGDGDGVFEAGEIGSVTVDATFDDFHDGSEIHTVTVFMPTGFSYDASSVTGIPGGTTIDDSDPTKIVFTVPTDAIEGTGSFTATFDVINDSAGPGMATFDAEARAVETTTGDDECDLEDNTAIAENSDDATVATIDPPTVQLSLPDQVDCIEEDSTLADPSNVATLTVTPVGDDEVTEIVISGLQSDWTYDFSGLEVLGATLTDSDPSDGSITLSVPNLAGYTGSFQVQPPADTDLDHPTITATATVVDGVDPALTTSGNGTLDIAVDAVADGGALVSGTPDTSDSGSVVDLNLALAPQGGNPGNPAGDAFNGGGFDTDGSESITKVVVTLSGDAGAVLTGSNLVLFGDLLTGTVGQVWTFEGTQAQLVSLMSTLQVNPSDDFEGDITVDIDVTTTEVATEAGNPAPDGDGSNGVHGYECTDANNSVTESFQFTVPVDNAAEPVATIGVSGDDCLHEDTESTLAFTADPQGPGDTITEIVISGFPSDWTVDTALLQLSDGGALVSPADYTFSFVGGVLTITLTGAAVDATVTGTIDVTPGEDSDLDGLLTIDATAEDGIASATTNNDPTTIVVDAVADGISGSGGDDGDSSHLSLDIEVTDNGGDGSFQTGELGVLTITATFDDYQDGSEEHLVTVTAPDGYFIGAAIALPAGVTVQSNDGTTLVLSVDSQDGDGQDGVGSFTATFNLTNVAAEEGSVDFTGVASAEEQNTNQDETQGDAECDLENNYAEAADTETVTADDPDREILNTGIITNTNSQGQKGIITFYDQSQILINAFAGYIVFSIEGQALSQANDTGFIIEADTEYTYGLEADPANDSRIGLDELSLEGVALTEPANIFGMGDVGTAGAANFAMSGRFEPDGTEVQVGTASTDGTTGADSVNDPTAGATVDYLFGDLGNDTLNGGAGADILNGAGGNDSLLGGDGADILVYDASDTIDGGAGNDLVRIDAIGSTITTFNDGGDTFIDLTSILTEFDYVSTNIDNVEGLLITDQPTFKAGDKVAGVTLIDSNGDSIIDESDHAFMADIGVRVALEASDIIDHADGDGDELWIQGNEGDIVNLLDADGTNDWFYQGTSGDFATYTWGANAGDVQATVHIEVGIVGDSSIDVQINGTTVLEDGTVVV